jgi:hypothetical protein
MQQDKIELLVCNSGSQNCKEHLLIINKCYVDATSYHLEKDYLSSIESLKCAFFCTSDLQETSCVQCANLFRSTITKTLENIKGELQELTSGLIGNRRYLKSYIESCAVLNDLQKGL